MIQYSSKSFIFFFILRWHFFSCFLTYGIQVFYRTLFWWARSQDMLQHNLHHFLLASRRNIITCVNLLINLHLQLLQRTLTSNDHHHSRNNKAQSQVRQTRIWHLDSKEVKKSCGDDNLKTWRNIANERREYLVDKNICDDQVQTQNYWYVENANEVRWSEQTKYPFFRVKTELVQTHHEGK